jgi:hypothetical protein
VAAAPLLRDEESPAPARRPAPLRPATLGRALAAAQQAVLAPGPSQRVARREQPGPLRRAVVLTGLPVLCLVLYVGLWTMAVRGGYHKNRLAGRIRALQVENSSLQAEVRRLQSPARIFAEASGLELQQATDMRFVTVPLAKRVRRR